MRISQKNYQVKQQNQIQSLMKKAKQLLQYRYISSNLNQKVMPTKHKNRNQFNLTNSRDLWLNLQQNTNLQSQNKFHDLKTYLNFKKTPIPSTQSKSYSRRGFRGDISSFQWAQSRKKLESKMIQAQNKLQQLKDGFKKHQMVKQQIISRSISRSLQKRNSSKTSKLSQAK